MEDIGELEAKYKKCMLSQQVSVSIANGTKLEVIPESFLKRCQSLIDSIDSAHLEHPPTPVDMKPVSEQTFNLFFLWSTQIRPSFDTALRNQLTLHSALDLARLASQYQVYALKNELSNLFRHEIVNKTWEIEPWWVRLVYEMGSGSDWLRRLVEDATASLVRQGRSRSADEMEEWCQVGRKHPQFFEAFVRRNGQGHDLSFIKQASLCVYHDHGDDYHELKCRTREEEWYPPWMFETSKEARKRLVRARLSAKCAVLRERVQEGDDIVVVADPFVSE